MICKNCNHQVIEVHGKFYHVVEIATSDLYKGIQIHAELTCSWRDEKRCVTCNDISFSEPCGCVEPKQGKP
jgi:hypothetical protein